MNDKPPACLSCNGKHFEIKPFEFTVETDEMFLTMKTDAWKCQECGTPVMNTKQMETMRQLLDLQNNGDETCYDRV